MADIVERLEKAFNRAGTEWSYFDLAKDAWREIESLRAKLREAEEADKVKDLAIEVARDRIAELVNERDAALVLVERAGPWSSIEQKEPEVGKKFICLWNDGSGCVMYWRHDCGFIDHDGDECAEIDWDKISFWAYLPDGFKFWCEVTSEDPMTLPLPSTEYASK
jgi:hypothetical protein